MTGAQSLERFSKRLSFPSATIIWLLAIGVDLLVLIKHNKLFRNEISMVLSVVLVVLPLLLTYEWARVLQLAREGNAPVYEQAQRGFFLTCAVTALLVSGVGYLLNHLGL